MWDAAYVRCKDITDSDGNMYLISVNTESLLMIFPQETEVCLALSLPTMTYLKQYSINVVILQCICLNSYWALLLMHTPNTCTMWFKNVWFDFMHEIQKS